MHDNEFKIIPVNGHFEIYLNGNFYCSADSVTEAEKEAENEINNIK